MSNHELTGYDDSIRRYTHKTKGGVYTVVTTALAAGDIRDVFGCVVVYRNDHGDVYVRSLESFKDNMGLID